MLLIALVVAAGVEMGRRAHLAVEARRASFVRSMAVSERRAGAQPVEGASSRRRSIFRAGVPPAAALMVALVLGRMTGPIGWPAGAAAGWALPIAWRRSKAHHKALTLEAQLGEFVESASLAVRAGLSISQALEFAAGEAEAPMSEIVERLFAEQRLGIPFDQALQRLSERLATDDARLFVLVVGIHARSGGDLAGALDEVASTIRHRIAVRRELRALSAQGRISGGVLGALPLLFFLVLAATSRRELEPVYRSAPGMAIIVAGLTMQGIAYLWIRKMLRVEV